MTWRHECASHSSTHGWAESVPGRTRLNPSGFWQDIADMYLDYRYFDELAAQSVIGQSLIVPVGANSGVQARHPPRSERRVHERDLHGPPVPLW